MLLFVWMYSTGLRASQEIYAAVYIGGLKYDPINHIISFFAVAEGYGNQCANTYAYVTSANGTKVIDIFPSISVSCMSNPSPTNFKYELPYPNSVALNVPDGNYTLVVAFDGVKSSKSFEVTKSVNSSS